jgi:hypothetical protein
MSGETGLEGRGERLGRVIELRKNQHLARTNERHVIAARLALLLRRRYATPLEGKCLSIWFETEAEARECQNLIVELGRTRKRPKVG